MEITIRAEQPDDGVRITDVVRRAYASVPYSDHREHQMVERLRRTEAYNPALSLLATVGDEAIGHILLTRAEIRSERSNVTTLALAPLSVVPEYQCRGIGTMLVESAHQRAADLGFGSIVLVGPAAYYRRFGYERLATYPILLPFDAPEEDRMILALGPSALDGVTGVVRYAQGWLDH